MTGHRIRLAGLGVFADARPDDHRNRKGRHSTDAMHHTRTGEVAVAMSDAIVAPKLREPSTTPRPIAKKGIGDRGKREGRYRERCELPTLGGSPRDDGSGRIHEDHLEQKHDHHADIVPGAGQEESFFAEEPPRLAADEVDAELRIQRTQTTKIGVPRTTALLEREAHYPVRE